MRIIGFHVDKMAQQGDAAVLMAGGIVEQVLNSRGDGDATTSVPFVRPMRMRHWLR